MDNLTDGNATSAWVEIAVSGNTSTMLPPGDKDDVLADVMNVLEYVNSVMLPTFLILGLVGNILTITIMQTKRYSHLTSRVILTCLACSDTALLLTQPFNKMFVMKLIGFDLRALSNLGCKIFFIIFKSAKITSSWCLVLLCIERFTAVWYPLKAKTICTKRNTCIALLVVYIFIFTFTSFMSYASLVSNGFCFHDFYDVNDPAEVLLFGNFVIMACIFYSLLPSSVMIILTPLIIYKLSKQGKLRYKMTGSNKSSRRDGNKINAMLIGIVIAYIILVIPNTSLHIFSFKTGVNVFWRNSNRGFIIFRDVTQILEQLNYAINFFLYVLTSKQFRDGMVDLLTCKNLHLRKISHESSFRSNSKNLHCSCITAYPQKEQDIEKDNEEQEHKISNFEYEKSVNLTDIVHHT